MLFRLWYKLIDKVASPSWGTISWIFLVHFWSTFVLMKLAGEGSIWDSFTYWYVVTASTVGYGDLSPSSQLGQAVVALWTIPGGVALFAAIIGKAVNDIGRKTRMNKDGLGQFGRFKDHVILVCDDDDAVQTLDDETTAKLGRHEKVVVTTGTSRHTYWIKLNSYIDKLAYLRANYLLAKRIVVMLEHDRDAISAVLTLASMTSKPIIVHFKDKSNVDLLKPHVGDNVEFVVSNTVELMARAMADPGISSVFEALMCSGNKDTLYAARFSSFTSEFEKSIRSIEFEYNCSVIAVRNDDTGEIVFVNSGDRVDTINYQTMFYIASKRISQ
ncbi:hypothetical protein KNU84_gp028 [Bacteriophage DSS3_VP1]|uniref:Potassium channel domain-containing protein n=1 Tax=Bacteriophage DSS3_VP1 TaxID=2664196 RepID=A0A7S5FRH1_9CAUD|nr:hypothetical protein KNU84_gp028 [Bacteriophage DSS3_VP1]QGH74676.1 hypothetical protein DSS3VP1_00108 [Bacteriophage DSS3_VP1]